MRLPTNSSRERPARLRRLRRAIVFVVPVAVACLAHAGLGCAQPASLPTATPSAPVLSVEELAQHPERYLGKTIRVVGKLENAGTNYFTDQRIVLRDQRGHEVYVRPWLPLEVPPGPSSGTHPKPATLSQHLGKAVELTAVVAHGELRKVGAVYYLDVKSSAVSP